MVRGGGGVEQRLLGAAAYDLDADVVLLIITIILTASQPHSRNLSFGTRLNAFPYIMHASHVQPARALQA